MGWFPLMVPASRGLGKGTEESFGGIQTLAWSLPPRADGGYLGSSHDSPWC